MFKERKKMAEALEKAFNHKKMEIIINQKKVMASFITDFGVTLHLLKDRKELFIDKLE
jgi:hypothetical protein